MSRTGPRTDVTVHELFHRNAVRTPNAVALVFAGGQLSYAALDARADRLARDLVEAGVAPGDRVGVLLDRGPHLVVAALAVLKAGAAYVMLDPSHPTRRHDEIMSSAGIAVVVADQDRPGSASGPVLVGVGEDRHRMGEPQDRPFEPLGGPDDAACVMFTSGSTGRPKGVVAAHRAVVATLTGQQYLPFGADEVWLQCAPVSWDAFALELWGPLLSGAICVLQPGPRPDPVLIGRLAAEHAVSTMYLSAGLFNVIVDEYPQTLERVRQVIVGGEAPSPQHVRRALLRNPALTIGNGYGPVESMVFATVHRVTLADTEGSALPLGTVLSGKRVYVLDHLLRQVKPGRSGELYVAGEGLAHGYLGRPGLTAQRFVADPFASAPGARLYRTGDLVGVDEDGAVRYLGRTDDQVKIRGFRVEPREIEGVFSAWPDIARVVVTARRTPTGDARLVGYVVPAAGHAPDSAELRRRAAQELPDHLVPSAVVLLPSLPLTPSGKLDRAALPDPESRTSADRPTALDADEAVLCGLIAGLLGIASVGRADSFLDLGGDSLSGMRLLARIAATFGVELDLAALFTEPTVAGLARLVRLAGQPARPPLLPRPRPAVLPVSAGQRRLWLANRTGDGVAYNVPLLLRLHGALDHDALSAALTDVVDRHEILRTTYPEIAGVPVQRVLPAGDPALTGCESVRGDELAVRIADAVRHRFDLRTQPPVHAVLYRVDEAEHALLLVLHHIAVDGWSLVPLLRDLESAYLARRTATLTNRTVANRTLANRPVRPDRAALPVQYADYTIWQRQLLDGDVSRRQLDHWREALRDAPAELPLPRRVGRAATPDAASATVTCHLPPEVHAGLRSLTRKHRCSLFMGLHAAVAATLHRFGSGQDIVLGTAVAGRTDRALDELVGYFGNSLVLRTDVSGDPSTVELLARVREFDLAAYANQDVPFDAVVEAIDPPRSATRHPLFQVLLVLQNTPPAQLDLPGLTVDVVTPRPGSARFDLVIEATDRYHDGTPAGLDITIEYRVDSFEPGTMASLASTLVQLCKSMVDSPGVPIGRLAALSAADQQSILRGWSTGPTQHTAGTWCAVHERIRAVAATTPDAPAIVSAAGTMAYRELLRRADGIAHRLRQHGAGPDALIGVCLPRDADALVSLLGIHCAGAGYLPLDPKQPDAYLAQLLKDAAPALVLSNSSNAPRVRELADNRTVLTIRTTDEVGNGQSTTVGPDHLAYVLFTSGSTGRPKGVAVTFGGLANLVAAQLSCVDIRSQDRVLQYASLGFDASVWEIFATWAAGAAVHIAEDEERLGIELFDRLRSSAITLATVPPTALASLPSNAPLALPALATLVSAGEACPAALADAWAPDRTFINAYGPTETTVCATLTRLDPHQPPDIGRPLPGLRVYVLDHELRPVPQGAPGEIYVGGPATARGYVNQPALTAARFVPDPYSPHAGQRMYRTGDLGAHTPTGRVRYLGRADAQRKHNGVRIEPTHIEAVLTGSPTISQAAVAVRTDEHGDSQLVAYLVAATGHRPDPSALRQHGMAALPSAMVPDRYVYLSALPLSANGKVNRSALPEPGEAPPARTTTHDAPRTTLEQRIADVWADVLRMGRISAHDNFFDIGGNSLRAVRASARLAETLCQPVSVSQIFAAPTVAQLAEQLGQDGASALTRLPSPPAHPPIPRLRRSTRPATMSLAEQERKPK